MASLEVNAQKKLMLLQKLLQTVTSSYREDVQTRQAQKGFPKTASQVTITDVNLPILEEASLEKAKNANKPPDARMTPPVLSLPQVKPVSSRPSPLAAQKTNRPVQKPQQITRRATPTPIKMPRRSPAVPPGGFQSDRGVMYAEKEKSSPKISLKQTRTSGSGPLRFPTPTGLRPIRRSSSSEAASETLGDFLRRFGLSAK